MYFYLFKGRGIPDELKTHKQNPLVAHENLPHAEEAAALYHLETGGQLTAPAPFAAPPFPSEDHRKNSEAAFTQAVPDLMTLLDSAVNRDYVPLQTAVKTLIATVRQYSV